MRSSTFLLFCVAVSVFLVSCEPLGLGGDDGPTLELDVRAPEGDGWTIVRGDTVYFIPSREHTPCIDSDTPCELPSILVEGREGTIHIPKGYFLTPLADAPLRGDVSLSGDEVEIRLYPDFDAVNAEGGVPDIPGRAVYEAWVRNLSAGTYDVRIIHEKDHLPRSYGLDDGEGQIVKADTTVEVE